MNGEWLVYDRNDGVERFGTRDEAVVAAETLLEAYREESLYGWDDEATSILVARVTHEVRLVVSRPCPEGSQFDAIEEYDLVRFGAEIVVDRTPMDEDDA